jgi:hypothetical protein
MRLHCQTALNLKACDKADGIGALKCYVKRAARPYAGLSGLVHFKPGNREKSVSVEWQAVVFNRQRGELCIGNEVSLSLSFLEHFLKQLPVFVGRLNQPDARLSEPALNPFCTTQPPCFSFTVAPSSSSIVIGPEMTMS